MGGYRSGYRSDWLEKNLAKKKTQLTLFRTVLAGFFLAGCHWIGRCQIWKLAAAKFGNLDPGTGHVGELLPNMETMKERVG